MTLIELEIVNLHGCSSSKWKSFLFLDVSLKFHMIDKTCLCPMTKGQPHLSLPHEKNVLMFINISNCFCSSIAIFLLRKPHKNFNIKIWISVKSFLHICNESTFQRFLFVFIKIIPRNIIWYYVKKKKNFAKSNILICILEAKINH